MAVHQHSLISPAIDGGIGCVKILNAQNADGTEKQVSRRIMEAILSGIDNLVRDHPICTSHHSWLVDVTVEKLNREKRDVSGDHGTQ